jgi:hypothetical protein
MMCILAAYILLYNLPAIPDRPMVTAWRPEMIITRLLEMGEFFPEYPACPAFQSVHLAHKALSVYDMEISTGLASA